jgi:hypothetical protein
VGAFLLEGAGAQIIVGEAPLQPATETGDVLIRRRIARKTTFVALVHHWGTDPEVSRVDAVGSGGPGGAGGFRVQAGTEQHLWVMSEDASDLSDVEADRTFSYPMPTQA